MYSFRQRPDTEVLDEPLYAYYLIESGKIHPGREEILKSQSHNGKEVFDSFFVERKKPILFCKQMTHHLMSKNYEWLFRTKNIIFIRHPYRIVSSYSKVITEVTMDDIGIKMQWKLFFWLQKHSYYPIVLDASYLLKHPDRVLRTLCKLLDIPFAEEMLHWPSGRKPEDGIWWPYWYEQVHKTQGFEEKESPLPSLKGCWKDLADQALPHYNALLSYAIK
jgi:hypothetical protein